MPYIHKTQYHNGIHTEQCVIDIDTLKDIPYYGGNIRPHLNSHYCMYVTCPCCKEEDCPVDSDRVLPYIDGIHLQCPLVLCDTCYRDKQIGICLEKIVQRSLMLAIAEYISCDMCNSSYTHIDTCSLCDRDIQLCVSCYIGNRHSEIVYTQICKECSRDKQIELCLEK